MEGSLNFLLVNHFGDERLTEIITQLDISDRRRGKLAFVKAVDLLPAEFRCFVQKFSELRNSLVHNVKNVDFNFSRYLAGLDASQRQALKGAISPILDGFLEGVTKENAEAYLYKYPRAAFFFCSLALMMRVYHWHQQRISAVEAKQLDQPIPKES